MTVDVRAAVATGGGTGGEASSSLDDLANLDARSQTGTDDPSLKEQGALVTEEGEADKLLAAAIRQVTALENQKAALLGR